MTRTILLADDSVTIQKVIELTFMDEDYEVVAVGNGDEALEKLEEVTPDFVIADVHMPGASGYEVARHSKSLRPEVPVLLLVSTFEPFDEEEAERSGCDAFLKKPFDSQELQRLVEELSAEARGEATAEASGEWGAPPAPDLPPAYPEGGEEAGAAGELDDEETHAEPFSIGLDEEDEMPPTRVAPPPEAVGSTAEEEPETLYGDEGGGEEAGATQAEPEVFELEPEDYEGAVAREAPAEPELPAETGAAEADAPEAAAPPPAASPLSDEDVDRIARRIVELVGDRPVRDVAWEVVPDLAEIVIRNRIRELETQTESVE
jgi:CheY-like chemotaxis protein